MKLFQASLAALLGLLFVVSVSAEDAPPAAPSNPDIGIKYQLEPTLDLIFVGSERETKKIQIRNTGEPVRVRLFGITRHLGTNDWTELDPPNTPNFILWISHWDADLPYEPLFSTRFERAYIVNHLQQQQNHKSEV